MATTTYYYPSNYGAAVFDPGSGTGQNPFPANGLQNPDGYTRIVVDSTTPNQFYIITGYDSATTAPMSYTVTQSGFSDAGHNETISSDGTIDFFLQNTPYNNAGYTFSSNAPFTPDPSLETAPAPVSPTEHFAHSYNVYSDGSGGFYRSGSDRGGQTIQDFKDPGASTDNLSQLGDIANDQFSATSDTPQNGVVTSQYVGKTAGGGVVAYNYGKGSYYLYTNNAYAPNADTGQVDTTHPFDIVCFTTGTLIRTARGDIAIETLAVGDTVVTASGTARPIKWIGKRSFDCVAHPKPEIVRPIRVQAGAFGGGNPYRDLTLSPHHAVAVNCLNEVLIPIRLLVNGTTIAQIDDAAEITYWHVELDSHDILVANGLSAESYIDVGNRCDFEGEATLTLHPHFKSDALSAYCRPLVTGGPVLSAVRSQLAALVGEPVIEATDPASFHVVIDGMSIAPVVDGHRAAFVVPPGACDIRLVSPTWSPRDADPRGADQRRLGLLIETLAIDNLFGIVTEIPLDHPGLVAGFHLTERTDFGTWRWTDGDALLTRSIWPNQKGPFVLRLTGQFHHVRAKTNMAEAA